MNALTCQAIFYDGKTSRGTPVTLKAFEGALILEGDGFKMGFRREAIRIAPRMNRTPGILYFDGGQKCESMENDALDQIAQRLELRQNMRWVRRLESNGWMVALALLLCFPVGFALYQFGIPAAANYVGDRIPQTLAQSLGADTTPMFDKFYFEPSELSSEQKARMRRAFEPLAAHHPDLGLNMNFRKMGVANAMALPDGTIFVTDKFVNLVEHDEEFQAVLAHEIGHVKNRHSLKKILATSSVAILISAYLGDASELVGVLTLSPAAALNAHYSRDYERDADLFAIELLHKENVDPIHFATMMEKLAAGGGGKASLLSSHPAPQERIDRFKAESAKLKDTDTFIGELLDGN